MGTNELSEKINTPCLSLLSASMLKSTKISKNLVDFIFQNVIKYFAEFNFCEATALCRVHFSELDANWKK